MIVRCYLGPGPVYILLLYFRPRTRLQRLLNLTVSYRIVIKFSFFQKFELLSDIIQFLSDKEFIVEQIW